MKTILEAISKIPLDPFRIFFLHASLLSLTIQQWYELRKAPRLEKKTCNKLLKPIFEMTSIKKRNLTLTIAALFFMAGCTSTRVASLAPSEQEKMEVYTTKIPERNYEELCYIQTDGSIYHTPAQLLKGLKKKAAEFKADAIINIKYDFQLWFPIASGTAIRYKDKS